MARHSYVPTEIPTSRNWSCASSIRKGATRFIGYFVLECMNLLLMASISCPVLILIEMIARRTEKLWHG